MGIKLEKFSSCSLVICLLAPMLLSSCGSMPIVQQRSVDTSEKTGQNPVIGATNNATVGSTLFSQFRYWSTVAYHLDSNVDVSLALGSIKASSGEILFPGTSKGNTVYCSKNMIYIDPLVGPTAIACFTPSPTNSGLLQSVTASPGVVPFTKELPTPAKFSNTEIISPRADSFRYELIYQGYSSKVLKFSYREFYNDMARAAYFQDASYDIDSFPTTVTFKNVKIEVLEAGNSGIKYRVLSGF